MKITFKDQKEAIRGLLIDGWDKANGKLLFDTETLDGSYPVWLKIFFTNADVSFDTFGNNQKVLGQVSIQIFCDLDTPLDTPQIVVDLLNNILVRKSVVVENKTGLFYFDYPRISFNTGANLAKGPTQTNYFISYISK